VTTPEPAANCSPEVTPIAIDWTEVEGDLLAKDVDALVNNPLATSSRADWLLPAGGVSGQLKARPGPEPVARAGSPTDGCRSEPHTSPRGPVAVRRATPASVAASTENTLQTSGKRGCGRIALP